MDVVTSKAGVPVRLTDERWFHIVENHDEVAGYYEQVLEAVEDPDLILEGYGGALIAAKALGRRKYLMVVWYIESCDERMVLSSPHTSRPKFPGDESNGEKVSRGASDR